MIISVNPKPDLKDFNNLMLRTDDLLNLDALKRPDYYASRGGNPLEDDVKNALEECAKGTPFENTIEKVSGQRFPDIVAAKYYGVEVKSTKENHWTSTGSSILETTRISDVERIYMTFGKLGGIPIEFKSKPYEECLYGIAVTHMPRYLIDMRLEKGETIFDKMGIPYDELRRMENPISPVSRYYRSKLKPGESLWWTGDAVEETVSATVRLWKTLSTDEKRKYMIYGCANFPEIFNGDYDNYCLWLTTSQCVVDPHIRDQFSAGGKEEMRLPNGTVVRFPAVYRRVKENLDDLICVIARTGTPLPIEIPPVKGALLKERILNWCDRVSRKSPIEYDTSMSALSTLFFGEECVKTSESVERSAELNSVVERPAVPSVLPRVEEGNIVCKSCGETYRQIRTRQIEGHRTRSFDSCPYCQMVNKQSSEWEFSNTKL